MARKIKIDRNVAEYLVDLLEDASPCKCGTWRIDLSDGIRREFGMCQMENYNEIREGAVKLLSSNTEK